MTVPSVRTECPEPILERFIYNEFGSFGGVSRGVAEVQVRNGHAVTVF